MTPRQILWRLSVIADIEKQQMQRDLTVMRLAQHGEKKDIEAFQKTLAEESLASSPTASDRDNGPTRRIEKGRSIMIENDLRSLGWMAKD